MFQGFEQVRDDTARKRWFASTGTGLLICGAAAAGIIVLSRQAIQHVIAEPPLEVTFRAAPEPEVATKPPPPPPPPPSAPRQKRSGKLAPTQPIDIPEEAPAEVTPTGTLEDVGPEEYGDGGDSSVTTNDPPPAPSPIVPDPDPIQESDPGVIAARPISDNRLPIYPEAARKKGVEAVVILLVEIGADGSVMSIRVIRGDEPFASAAVFAVKTWRYEPARIDGRATTVSRRIKIPFRLHS